MSKYIIELEPIEGTNLYRAKGANTLVFDENGIKNILKPCEEEEKEVDWTKVAVDTPILVREGERDDWVRRYFAKYENGLVYAWGNGATSWTYDYNDRVCGWMHAKLAEESEKNE